MTGDLTGDLRKAQLWSLGFAIGQENGDTYFQECDLVIEELDISLTLITTLTHLKERAHLYDRFDFFAAGEVLVVKCVSYDDEKDVARSGRPLRYVEKFREGSLTRLPWLSVAWLEDAKAQGDSFNLKEDGSRESRAVTLEALRRDLDAASKLHRDSSLKFDATLGGVRQTTRSVRAGSAGQAGFLY